jgi:hypothetical protein
LGEGGVGRMPSPLEDSMSRSSSSTSVSWLMGLLSSLSRTPW